MHLEWQGILQVHLRGAINVRMRSFNGGCTIPAFSGIAIRMAQAALASRFTLFMMADPLSRLATSSS